MQQAQSDLASQQALNQALSQLQASRQSISGAGQQMAQAQQGQGQMPGQEQNPGQGAGQGQASGGGGGTNANQLPPSTRSGTAGDPQGQGINTGTSNLDSQVYVPREKPGGSSNEELYVPGQDTDQGETQSSEKPDPLGGLNNPALVPYNEVFQQYHDAASQAIDQSAIPPGLKDYNPRILYPARAVNEEDNLATRIPLVLAAGVVDLIVLPTGGNYVFPRASGCCSGSIRHRQERIQTYQHQSAPDSGHGQKNLCPAYF